MKTPDNIGPHICKFYTNVKKNVSKKETCGEIQIQLLNITHNQKKPGGSFMKKILLVTLVLSSLNVFAATQPKSRSQLSHDANYLSIASVEVQDLTSQYPESSALTDRLESLSRNNRSALFETAKSGTQLDKVELIVDQIINIGTKVWNVIEAGRPVQSYTRAQATALPGNSRSWEQLENWQRPTSRVLGVSYKNLYGIEVVKFVYRVVLLYGGSVDGTGKYIGYAAVEPVEINTAWMYTFNASASVQSVYNMGTRSNPLAGMILNVNWTVETVLKKSTNGVTLTLDGNGGIRAPAGSSLN